MPSNSDAKLWGHLPDFHGHYYTLTGSRNEPKPLQQPGPPLLIGSRGDRTLRLVAVEVFERAVADPDALAELPIVQASAADGIGLGGEDILGIA